MSGLPVSEVEPFGQEDTVAEPDNNENDEEQETVEPPYVPLTAVDIPFILEALEASDSDTWNSGLNKLNGIIYKQAEFAADNLSLLDLPRIVKAATAATDGTLRTCILEAIVAISGLSDAAQQLVVPNIPDLMPFLSNGDVLDRHNILSLLEQLAEAEPSSHDLIIAGATSLYHSIGQLKEGDINEAYLAAIIGSFETTMVYSRVLCRNFFVRGHAIDAVLGGTWIGSAQVRLAAVSCLVQLSLCTDEVDADLPDESDRGKVIIYIFERMFHLLKDEDDAVLKEALEFIGQGRGQQDSITFAMVVENPDVIPALVVQLAKKELNTVGAPAEYALVKFLEREESKPIVRDGFRTVWNDSAITTDTKLKVVSGLIDSFLDIRKMALDGGLCEFMVEEFRDEKYAVRALNLFSRLMEQEQIVGSVILNTPSMLDKIIDIFETSSSQIRCCAAAILQHTLGSYNYDSEAQGHIAAKAFFQPNIFPRLLAGLDSDDPSTVNASAKLVAEILATEEGTKGWNSDESDTTSPPTPIKDATITDELTNHVIGLLKISEAAPGALYLLCQFGWGNQRGFNVLKKGFEAFIEDADAFFFAALDGEYESRHASLQRRVVAEAVLQAGGIQRVVTLLEKDHTTAEARRAVVNAFRILLTADSADLAVGRKNARLPGLLSELFADETSKSMRTAAFIIRLLSDHENPNVFESWTDFATVETVNHLVYWLNKPPTTFERPDTEKMSEEEFEKADAEYDKNVMEADNEANENIGLLSEILGYLTPILTPFASQLVLPILNFTNKFDQNHRLLELLASFTSNEVVLKEALVPAVKALLSQNPPPDLSTCYSWILCSPSLATGFFLGGLIERIEKEYEPTEEGEVYGSHQAIQIYKYLVKQMDDIEHKQSVRKAFWAFKPAANQALGFLRDKENVYGAIQAADELYILAKYYPEGFTILENEQIYSFLLELFDNKELDSPWDVGPLIGHLCHQDVEALTKLIRSHITGLMPPPDEPEVPSEERKGKKGQKGKKGKKKKFNPRIQLHQVLDRCASLVKTTPSARKVLWDAGAIELAHSSVSERDQRHRKLGLRILQGFVECKEGDYCDAIAKFLPQFGALMKPDWNPLLEIVRLARAFLPDNVQYLIQTEMHRILFKVFSDFPSATEDMAYIINTIRDLGNTERGRRPLIEVIKSSLESEKAFIEEQNWGNSHALRRLLYEGEPSSTLVVESGAVDYAIRMLKAEDRHIIAIGGALCMTLVRNEFIGLDVRPKLLGLGASSLIEEGLAKCIEQSNKPFDAELDGEESDFKERQATNKIWIDNLEASLKAVGGEDVDFEENIFL